MESGRSSKRVRVDSPGSSCNITTYLPNDQLVQICSYLPKISSALFAVALTAPSESWRNYNWKKQPLGAGKAIVLASSWEVLDFVEVEAPLAQILDDDDVGALLACIDAVNKVKRLKLTGCLSIKGSGLQPLAGSSVLEQIDLSLVKEHENLRQDGSISILDAIPILLTIVQKSGSHLKQFQPYYKWWKRDSLVNAEITALDSFLTEYAQLLNSRPFNCLECSSEQDCTGSRVVIGANGALNCALRKYHGLQQFTCYSCLENFCNARERDYSLCFSCGKSYCSDCMASESCGHCENAHCKLCINNIECDKCETEAMVCNGCAVKSTCCVCHGSEGKVCGDCKNMEECFNCDKPICEDCAIFCDSCESKGCRQGYCGHLMLKCDGCSNTSCVECGVEEDAVQQCEICESTFCGDCRENPDVNYSRCCRGTISPARAKSLFHRVETLPTGEKSSVFSGTMAIISVCI